MGGESSYGIKKLPQLVSRLCAVAPCKYSLAIGLGLVDLLYNNNYQLH